MDESTQRLLKIRIEQSVRPVIASYSRKQKMREELLTRAIPVYDSRCRTPESSSAALDQTFLLLGQPLEITRQLQASVPVTDSIGRFIEGPPHEPAWRCALRFIAVIALISLAALAATLLLVGWIEAWSLRELWMLSFEPGFLPLSVAHAIGMMSCFVLAVSIIDKGHVDAPSGGLASFLSVWQYPNSTRCLIRSFYLFMATILVIYLTANRSVQSPNTINWTILPLSAVMASLCVWGSWHMVRYARARQSHHAEWDSLPLELTSHDPILPQRGQPPTVGP